MFSVLNGAAVSCGFPKLQSLSCTWVALAPAEHQPCGLGVHTLSD